MSVSRRNQRQWVAVLIGAATIAGLAACGTESEVNDLDLTLYEAKAIAQQEERDIVALIPEDAIDSVDQRPTGSLLSCTGERNYQWAGGTTIHLAGGTNRERLINDVVQFYGDKEGWSVIDNTEPDGTLVFTIARPLTGGYLISGWHEPLTIQLLSFSPCFHLPDDMTPHGSY